MTVPAPGRCALGHPLELRRPRRVHLVGIGGAGMSGIATILATMGHTVTGSDRQDSPTLRRLAAHGVTVGVGHDPARVAAAEIVGASSAVPPSDPELVEAARLGLGVRWRVELLAAICDLRRTVAVAGTKGKTTTTAMVARILDEAGERPSLLVGGDLPGVDGGARWVPDSDWFVVEADESDGTFLALPAEAVLVTNVEADHLDQYGSLGALQDAFASFASRAARVAVIGVDSPGSHDLASRLAAEWATATVSSAGRAGPASGSGSTAGPVGVAAGGGCEEVETTGVPAAFRAARQLVARAEPIPGSRRPSLLSFGTATDSGVRVVAANTEWASASFVLIPGALAGSAVSAEGSGAPPGTSETVRVELPVPGLHNVRNAAGALAVTAAIGIPLRVGVRALAGFRPVARRFEWRGERNGVAFVDDYAHVPSAVATTLAAARAGGWARIVAVFQPHLYSRTEALGEELGRSLAAADLVVVADVYGAREDPRPGVDGSIVAAGARRARPGLDVRYVPDRSSLASVVAGLLRAGDLCLSLGAGDVTTLAEEIADAGRQGAQG